MNCCDVNLLKKELSETRVIVSQSGTCVPDTNICNVELEKILKRLLHFLKRETFQGATKEMNERVLIILDGSGSRRVDLGFF